jgi:hypothetical protein
VRVNVIKEDGVVEVLADVDEEAVNHQEALNIPLGEERHEREEEREACCCW